MRNKKLIPFILLLLGTFSFASCTLNNPLDPGKQDPADPTDPVDPDPTDPTDPDPEDPEPETPSSIGNRILHCFNWNMNNIKSNLSSIKDAGFNMIQISPMQPQKDPYNGNWRDQWWKLYQPLGFKVATGNENKLGTKDELISLCSEAEKLGIDVIVDVVANHLSSSNKKLAYAVKNFEPDIYNNNLIHETGKSIDDDVIWGNMGELCDLKTEDSRVQARVLSLLKEYVDCGIDGFRFDAAKHIETEYDSEQYRSNFWKNTLDQANSYAESQYNRELFSYGEILGSAGPGRKYSFYTCRMGITDSDQGSNVLKAARGSTSFVSNTYNTKESPSNLVLWAESHDTYSNSWGESKDDSISTIQKGYVMQASRKDVSILYFARPQNNTNLGQVGDTSFKNDEVKAINAFNKKYATKSENVTANNGCFVNVRGSSGAAIVRLSGSSTRIEVPGLADGKYLDLISNNEFTVSDGAVSVPSNTTYCILASDSEEEVSVPTLNVTYEEVYSTSQTITVTAEHADSVTYSLNDAQEVTLSGSNIVLPNTLENGKVSLKIKAKNNYGSTSQILNMVKTDTLVNKELIITDIDPNYTYYLWTWGNQSGKWREVAMESSMIGCDLEGDNMFIVVKFDKNVTAPDWGKKVNQTENISKTQRVYCYNDLEIAQQ